MTQATQTSRPSARERRKTFAMTLTGVFMLLYAASLVADIVLDANLFWLTALFVLATGAGAIVWARTLDEAKLNAHYIAWYWGGSAGLMLSALTFVALIPTLVTPNGLNGLVPPAFAPFATNLSFGAGLVLGMFPAMIGYLIWWGVLWARRR
jgi:hypothetical protein